MSNLKHIVFFLLFILVGFSCFKAVAQTDTLLMPFDKYQTESNGKDYQKMIQRLEASDDFYLRLKKRADSAYLYKQLFPLIFKKPSGHEEVEIDNLPANATFKPHQNKIIRNIRIIKLEVFGSSVYDTTDVNLSGITRTINNLHIKTRNEVISNYITIKEGDMLDAVKVSDNERIIRNAPIFEDARFIVEPVNADTVDMVLLVKDVFPFGVDLKVTSVNKASLRLYNRNIFGMGHQLGQEIGYDASRMPSFFPGEGSYVARNIRNTFTDLSFFWSGNPYQKRIGVEISRPFITPEIRFAGGIYISYSKGWLFDNKEVDKFEFSNRLFDAWAGYAVITNRLKDITSRRQQAAVTARIYQLDYFQMPHFMLLQQPPFMNVTQFLTGINILRSEFYRTNMLYGYGRTEDIPYGHHAELITGWETSEVYNRFYSAIKLNFMKPVKGAGLLGLDVQLGGYVQKGNLTDGVFKTTFKVISPLFTIGRNSIRNFGYIGYVTGINRSVPGLISINDGNSGNLFKNYDLNGYERIRGRVESVIFTPYYLLGFRFAPYWYAEAAVIAPKGERFASSRIFPALGIGVRLRNENLVFSTFQISFSWHPGAPSDVKPVEFILSDFPQTGLETYLINRPEMVEYR